MSEPVICTIITKNYLAYARVLNESFKSNNPKGILYVLLADRPDGYFDLEKEKFKIFNLKNLKIKNLYQQAFKYSPFEFACFLKPYFLDFLLKRFKLQRLIFFDSDIFVTGKLDKLDNLLKKNSIVLTPHITSPIKDNKIPNELDFLKTGTFNGGFIGVKNDSNSRVFLTWWKNSLYDDCLHHKERGFYVDQKWLNLAPAIFEDVRILKNPGYNVAYWNLHERSLAVKNKKYYVNSKPLTFFHFSGFDIDNYEILSVHQTRFNKKQLKNTLPLIREYRSMLIKNDHRTVSKWPYFFNYFSNENQISKRHRRFYFRKKSKSRFDNPFDTGKSDNFYEYYKKSNQISNKVGNLLLKVFYWGYYTDFVQSRRYKIKKIIGSDLSSKIRDEIFNYERSK